MHLKKVMLAVFLISLPICAQVNNSAIIYADQYTSPLLSYQDIVNNICPANGCTIYATSPNASQNLGTLDPGTKVVTIYLGPFTYSVDHIILQKGFRIIGMGASDAGTILQSTNTSNYPMFLLPQTNNSPANIGVQLYGAKHITFVGSHHEALNGAYQLQSDGNVSTKGVLISNAFFAGNVGVNGGNGFLVNAIGATVVTLQGAVIDGTPNFIVTGASSGNVSRY